MLGLYLASKLLLEVNAPFLASLIIVPALLSALLYFRILWARPGLVRWLSFLPLVVGVGLAIGPFINANRADYTDYYNVGFKLLMLYRLALFTPLLCLVALLVYDFVRGRKVAARSQNIF